MQRRVGIGGRSLRIWRSMLWRMYVCTQAADPGKNDEWRSKQVLDNSWRMCAWVAEVVRSREGAILWKIRPWAMLDRAIYRSSRLPTKGPHLTGSNSESMHVLDSSLRHISSRTATVKPANDGAERVDVCYHRKKRILHLPGKRVKGRKHHQKKYSKRSVAAATGSLCNVAGHIYSLATS